MKTISRSTLLMLSFIFLQMQLASAITFTNLYTFNADGISSGGQFTNSDGINPYGIVVSGNFIYGTAYGGGTFGYGTIFRVNTDGTHFTNLFNFNLGTYDPNTSSYPNSTGDEPNPGLLLVSNTLYGTTFSGGINDAGTVFKFDIVNSAFSLIKSFAFTNGQGPQAGLTLYSNVLYGTTAGGGTNGNGTVFTINLSDSTFTKIRDFINPTTPYGGVVVSSNGFFGFAYNGGTSSQGYVYRVGGAGNADLFDFNATSGMNPWCTPLLIGNTLFGVTFSGGVNGSGNIFRIDTSGNNFTNLYSFTPANGANLDGANPYVFNGLINSGNTLYGTTSSHGFVNGNYGNGTLFSISTSGSNFTVLHTFQSSVDGSQPGGLFLNNGSLYGVTTYGLQGYYLGDGGIFDLILQPTLNIALSRTNAVLTWNDPSFSLYASTNLTSTFSLISGATSPYTNHITGTQKYFQLH
jgi:uncharacterized repeat protein (TIGR03803 family)